MPELNYGQALEAVKEGKLIAREGWNGKNMFVFLRPADELDVDFIIRVVKSLPTSVKQYYENQESKREPHLQGIARVWFTPYLCLKSADGSIVNGWNASQTDMLANDWGVLDPNKM